jgi:four helix bundle protein
MEKIESFEDLTVWNKSHRLAVEVYKLTKAFPSDERFGLTSQMRRAAVSIPANICEGFKKRSPRDKCNFYNIAQGSLEELRYYFILSKDLQYISKNEELLSESNEIGRMLTGLIKSVAVN